MAFANQNDEELNAKKKTKKAGYAKNFYFVSFRSCFIYSNEEKVFLLI